MKISIDLTTDSHNTYVSASLEVSDDGERVDLRISDSDRTVSVTKADLRRLLVALLS
jgi:hypothetical protein